MPLPIGTQLGSHEITALLGKGGMGEVYRALDLKLKREVAIKILPEEFSRDSHRIGRFQREAEVLAALNHPNIAAIHDLQETNGTRYLVLELVEGETLADRIARGPIPVEETLTLAKQICEALEAAHERGVIHRDLKPANVKITSEGKVKVLDFGLAKAMETTTVNPALSHSPTLLTGSMAGMIMGTAAYMAPEQASGAKVDRRADIWSFGVVLFEMLSRKRAFEGDSAADTLATVMKLDPDWGALPAETPVAVRNLLRRCLSKDRKQRLQAIGEARIVLEAPTSTDSPAHVATPSRSRILWTALGLMTAIAASAGWIAWRTPRSVVRPLLRISAQLVPGDTLSTFGLDQNTILSRAYPGTILALSHDGTHLVVEVREADGTSHLATRRLDQRQFSPIRGTDGGGVPFFSPDDQWVAFVANRKLKKIPIEGGATVTLCEAGNFASGSWGDDGYIIAALNLGSNGLPQSGLSRISPNGGTPVPITELRNGERSHRWPQVLPGSQAVLFTAYTGESPEDADIGVVSLKTHQQKMLLHGGFMGKYIAASERSGYLVYGHQNTLYAAPFDLDKLALTGTPRPVLDDVSSFGTAPAEFDFSQTGIFVYVSGNLDPKQSIFWLDSSGKTVPLHSVPGYYNSMRFSHDGKSLAFATGDATVHEDILVKDLARTDTIRLTALPGTSSHPVWTPDDKHIVFQSNNQPEAGVYWAPFDGSSAPQRVAGVGYGSPLSVSPDGKQLGFANGSAVIEGGSDHPRFANLERFPQASGVSLPAFSPNFRWVAYRSDETGTPEVYVRPFPGLGAKKKISTGGGWFPIWSPNGHELFFLSFFDRRIMAVDYTTTGDSFMPGTPHVWSDKRVLLNLGGGPLWPYGLAPDGKRFAVLLYPDGTAEAKPTAQLTFLLNFVDYLRQDVLARN